MVIAVSMVISSCYSRLTVNHFNFRSHPWRKTISGVEIQIAEYCHIKLLGSEQIVNEIQHFWNFIQVLVSSYWHWLTFLCVTCRHHSMMNVYKAAYYYLLTRLSVPLACSHTANDRMWKDLIECCILNMVHSSCHQSKFQLYISILFCRQLRF